VNDTHSVLVGTSAAAFLGIKMVLSRLARQNLAIFGDLETLGVWFCGFHWHGI